MHVGAKKMATAGLLVAFSVIMMLLSSVVESVLYCGGILLCGECCS